MKSEVLEITTIEWFDAKSPPAFETSILFKNTCGTFAGTYMYISDGNRTRNMANFVDFRKGKIRQNVIKWAYMP